MPQLAFPESSEEQPSDLPLFLAEEQQTSRVPGQVAVTVLSEEEIGRAGFGSIESLSAEVPNFNVSSNSLRSFGDIFTIRGLGNTAFFSEPAVTLYIDGVPMGDAYTYAIQLMDIEEISIHRGPQGTRYGRNSEAGVIDIRTRGPDDQYRASVLFKAGSFDGRMFQLAVSGPIVEKKLYFRLAGLYEERGGFVYNRFLDRHTDTKEAWGGHFKIGWKPNRDWRIDFGFNLDRFDDGSQRVTSLDSDPFEVSSDFEGLTRIRRDGEHVRLVRTFSWGTFASMSSRQFWKLEPNELDLDLSPVPGFTSTINQRQEQWSQEFRLESSMESRSPWMWKAGLFLSTSETLGNSLRTFFTPPIPFPLFVTQLTIFRYEQKNIALFGNLTRSLSEKLDLSVGFRLNASHKKIERVKTDSFAPPRIVTGDRDFTDLAPSIELTYRANNNLSIFASSAIGFKPGGFTAFTDDPLAAKYETETVWSSQASVRYSAPNGSLTLQVTGFWNEVEDYQVERSFTFTDYTIVNAKETRSRGIEIETELTPVAGFNFTLGFGYTDIVFRDYIDPFTGARFSENRAPFSPKYTLNFGFQYEHPSGIFTLLKIQSLGETFFDETESARFRQSSFTVVNLAVGLKRERFEVSLFGRNLTGTVYYTNKITDINAGVPGEPRLYGISATFKY